MADPAEKIEFQQGSSASAGTGAHGVINRIDTAWIIARVKAVLTNPKEIWGTLKSEPITTEQLFKYYLAPLAALSAICGFVGMVIFGISLPLVGTIRVPFFSGLVNYFVQFLMGLMGIAISGFIVEKLAPSFGGKATFLDGVKLIGYAMTAPLVFSVLSLVPVLEIVGGVLGFYGLYLIYQGIPSITQVPAAKHLVFFLATIVCTFVAMFVVNWIAMTISPWSMSAASTPVIFEGNENFDPAKIQQGIKELEKLIPKSAQ